MWLFGSWHNTERLVALPLAQQPPNVLKILSQHYLKCPLAFQLKEGIWEPTLLFVTLFASTHQGPSQKERGPFLSFCQDRISSIPLSFFPLDRLCSSGLSFFSVHLAWPKDFSSVNEPVMVSPVNSTQPTVILDENLNEGFLDHVGLRSYQ